MIGMCLFVVLLILMGWAAVVHEDKNNNKFGGAY